MTFTKLATITFTCASVFATSAFAQNNFQSSCDANINADLNFSNNQLLVKSITNQDILFHADGAVFIDGKSISLTAPEQTLTKSYYKGVEETIPMAVDITIEALSITNLALTEVFTGLLGEKNSISSKIDSRLGKVASSIKEHVYQNPDSLTFNSEYLKRDLGLGNDVDQEIQKIQEEIMTAAMGELLLIVGQSMMSGNNDFVGLQKRMENIGDEIEEKAGRVGKQLEKKTTVLCEKLKSLDDTEDQLQKVSALRHLNMIDISK